MLTIFHYYKSKYHCEQICYKMPASVNPHISPNKIPYQFTYCHINHILVQKHYANLFVIIIIEYRNIAWHWIHQANNTVTPDKRTPLFRHIGNYRPEHWNLIKSLDYQIAPQHHTITHLSRERCNGRLFCTMRSHSIRTVSSPSD